MGDMRTDEFVTSLRRVDVSVARTTVEDFGDVVEAAVSGTAVGVALPFDDISLEETHVTLDPTPEELRTASTGITPGEFGITSYGSVILRCTGEGAEFLALYPDRHIIVLTASNITDDMPDGIDAIADGMRDDAADFIVATGPSATADMGAVVQGVHGPSEVHAIILEDR